jgi:hypothetical protein
MPPFFFEIPAAGGAPVFLIGLCRTSIRLMCVAMLGVAGLARAE